MDAFTGDKTCVWRLKHVLRHQYTVPSTNRHIPINYREFDLEHDLAKAPHNPFNLV